VITRTSAEAQNQFGQLLDTVQRERVAITRHGRPTAVVISANEMEEIDQERKIWRERISADWEEWRQKARKSLKPAAASLTDEEINRMVHDLR